MLAVALLTLGVVTSALADAQAKGQSFQVGMESNSNISGTFLGFGILALAMVLSAFQGIFADRLYETYGRNHWKEALFYSHALSLPLFLPTLPQLSSQWHALTSSPSLLSQATDLVGLPGHSHMSLTSGGTIDLGDSCAMSMGTPIKSFLHFLMACQHHAFFQSLLTKIPVQVFYLFLNALTQYWCIRGVHRLSAKSSSLTVTVVLNIRKLVSLLLSIKIFGNALSHGVVVGAVLVFMGGAMYGFESARLRRAASKRD
ncbi:UAA transporter [Aspergillus unguis]